MRGTQRRPIFSSTSTLAASPTSSTSLTATCRPTYRILCACVQGKAHGEKKRSLWQAPCDFAQDRQGRQQAAVACIYPLTL
jgi:hypothetical protein